MLGLVGQKLGPYVVRQVATMGGVAVIYRGEHEALHSTVAIKVLTPELVEDSVRPTLEQMFLREAQILSQLRSDDILRALDHGRIKSPKDGQERPYIVVDWMDGRPLSDELERRRLETGKPYELAEAIETLEPIARALAYAHESGIVHRDVNPRNVFLQTVGPGRPPRAKLIDFGFAKEVARTEALRLQNVDGTLFARSPDYAAPEHYDREAYGELSENTDIYTFALMLVEMLTLEPPLRGTSDTELLKATTDRTDRPTPNNRGAHVGLEVEKLFAEAVAVDQFERPGVLLDWWERLKAAAAGSSAAAPQEAKNDPSRAGDSPDASGPSIELGPTAGADSSGPSIEVAPAGATGRANDSVDFETERERPELPSTGFARIESSSPRSSRTRLLLALALATTIAGATWGAYLVRNWRVHASCPQGFGDCNDERADACETNLAESAAHCGSCGHSCASGESCTNGTCQKSRCPLENLRDCNQVPSDGCEVDVRTDAKNCGDCGKVCGSAGAKQAACVAGTCEFACRPGFGDCDHAAENGCEALFSTDAKNCGRCGFSCFAGCADGVCAPKTLAGPLRVRHLHAQGDTLYFWDVDDHRIDRISAEGLRGTVVDHADDVAGLVATADRLIWAGGPKNEVFTRLFDGPAATRVAGPFASETPILFSADGTISFSNRAKRAEPVQTKSGRPALSPPPSPRLVLSIRADSVGDKSRFATAECNQWPAAFAGGSPNQYCCDRKQPLTLVECHGASCAYRPLDVMCPDVLADDGQRLYFAEEMRIAVLDRKDQKVATLSKRKRQPRTVTIGGDYVYWLEGEPLSDVFRIKRDSSDPTSAEMIARRQIDATEIAATDRAVFWVSRAPGESATGAKRVARTVKPNASSTAAAEAPQVIQVVRLSAP